MLIILGKKRHFFLDPHDGTLRTVSQVDIVYVQQVCILLQKPSGASHITLCTFSKTRVSPASNGKKYKLSYYWLFLSPHPNHVTCY